MICAYVCSLLLKTARRGRSVVPAILLRMRWWRLTRLSVRDAVLHVVVTARGRVAVFMASIVPSLSLQRVDEGEGEEEEGRPRRRTVCGKK